MRVPRNSRNRSGVACALAISSSSLPVKLSALHPRYSRAQAGRVMAELLPRVRELALAARAELAMPAARPARRPRAAAKAAVVTFTEVLQHENRGSGVQFVCVCPPTVATPLLALALPPAVAAAVLLSATAALADPAVLRQGLAALPGTRVVKFCEPWRRRSMGG